MGAVCMATHNYAVERVRQADSTIALVRNSSVSPEHASGRDPGRSPSDGKKMVELAIPD
jgi:hypothetical protein